MTTFEQLLSTTAWTEVLSGGSAIYFDQLGRNRVDVLFTDTASTPSATTSGNAIEPQKDAWDFFATGLVAGTQRIWAKAQQSAVTIRGIR